MRRSPTRSFSAAAPSTPISARSFTSSRSGTAVRRLVTRFSTDCSNPASAEEVAGFVRERVVMKLEALQNRRPVKLPHVIGTQHHHRKSFGQRAALVLEPEEGLDRLDGRHPRNRLAQEAERARPLPHDIDEDGIESPDEFLGREVEDREHRQQAGPLGGLDIDVLSLQRPDVERSDLGQREQHARLAGTDAVAQKRKTQAKTAGIAAVEAPKTTS